MSKEEIRKDRPEAFFRIQKRDEFKQFCNKERYINSGQIEVKWFSVYEHKLFNKKGAEAKHIVAGHIRDVNKGYPDGFKGYLTYDEKFNKAEERKENI